ncbi:uncharacterized protein G2W53_020945 [Senna tora]|uniref:Uncharacterized protein n=1 Tax=Senna tora TaxID=362788 RepID=A0A834WKL9_9FABA|nr:uncharacterized protein G2W53_020945 [Senna tora]
MISRSSAPTAPAESSISILWCIDGDGQRHKKSKRVLFSKAWLNLVAYQLSGQYKSGCALKTEEKVVGRKVEWGGSNGPREGQKGMYEERKVGTVKKVSTEELMEKLARMSMTENKETQLTNVAEMMGVGEENDGCKVGVELMKVAKTVINMNKEGGFEVAGTKQNKTLDTVNDVSKSNSVEGSNASMLDIVVNSQNVAVKGRTGGVRKFKRMAREKENCIPLELVKTEFSMTLLTR